MRVYAHNINTTMDRVGDSAASLGPSHLNARRSLFPPTVQEFFETCPADLVVFTDGSWRQAGLPQMHLFYPDHEEGVGEAGLVVTSASQEWGIRPLYIRITGGRDVGASSSYDMFSHSLMFPRSWAP
jgi:hypothetical protein